MGSNLGAELLCPEGVIVPVVREPENDGVFEEAVGLQVFNDSAGIVVSLADGIK